MRIVAFVRRSMMAMAFIGLVCLARNAGAASFSTLYSFTGSNDGGTPAGPLAAIDGTLYGIASAGGKFFAGTIYRFNPATNQTSTLYSFPNPEDGVSPTGSLVQVGNLLYGVTQAGGGFDQGSVFSLDPKTLEENTIYRFTGEEGGSPAGGLCAFDGILFGVTFYGGRHGEGTVFRLDPTTGTLTVLHQFVGTPDGAFPATALVRQGPLLYGTTSSGGAANAGTVFRVNPTTGSVGTVYAFAGGTDGAQPLSDLISSGGYLYGTSAGGTAGWGTVFRIEPITRAKTTLYNFSGNADGAYPIGLVADGNLLYGTTETDNVQAGTSQGGGVIFSLDPSTCAETTLYSFPGYASGGSGGYNLNNALTLKDGLLYGVAASGGEYGVGTEFSFDPASNTVATLHSFNGTAVGSATNSGLIGFNGVLLGTSAKGGPTGGGEVFRIRRATGMATLLHAFTGAADSAMPHAQADGAAPHAGLINVGGDFYGTTAGPFGGTIYRYDPQTGVESVVHNFGSGSYNAAADPEAELVSLGGLLYGTSFSGGGSAGTIFSFNPANGAEATLYDFGQASPAGFPKGGLLAVGSVLYGTTSALGSGNAASTVFGYDTSTASMKTLHTLTSSEGLHPVGTLVQSGGLLYGTTSTDGPHRYGTVFSVDPTTGALVVLHAFTGFEGAPLAGLTLFNSTLIGTTSNGGVYGGGIVFQINLLTGVMTTLYVFTDSGDGGAPTAPLFAVGGTLYGTTSTAGANNLGTVFSVSP